MRIAAAFTAPPLIRHEIVGQAVSLADPSGAEPSGSALALMAGWMLQYGDLPLDLADASLLWVAQEQGLRRSAAPPMAPVRPLNASSLQLLSWPIPASSAGSD
jgi:hypothetical protein